MGDSRFKVYFIVTILFIFLMVFFVSAQDSSSANYKSKSSITANAGGNSSSTNFISKIVGGIISGDIFSNSFKNFVGFFQATVVDIISPVINFTSTTPINGSILSASSMVINVSASDDVNYISSFIDLDNSLVSWWRMDDLNSSGGVVDYTGRNNGTAVGNATQTDAGKLGKAFDFDGSGDYIVVGNNNVLNFANGSSFTLSSWIYTQYNNWSATSGGQYCAYGTCSSIIYRGDTSFSFVNYGLRVASETSLRFVKRNTGEDIQQYSFTTSNLTDRWANVVTVFQGNNVSIYRDGVYLGSQTSGFINDSLTFQIFYLGGVYTYFNGSIDDVMVFNRSLTAGEVAGLYANMSSKYYLNNFTALGDGDHTFKAYAQDTSGNVNSTELRGVTIDTIFPTVNFTSPTPTNGSSLSVNSLIVNVSVSDLNNVSSFIDLDGSLISWWRMDDLNSSGDVVDYTGRHNGSVFGDAVQTDAGKLGKAFDFPGDDVTSYVSINEGAIDGLGNFSTSLWIRKDSAGSEAVLSGANSGTDNEYLLFTSQTSFSVYLQGASDSWIVTLGDGNWHNIVFTRNGTQGIIYQDGVSKGISVVSATALNIDTNGFVLGQEQDSVGGGFSSSQALNGSLDDVLIFNRTLSSGEIVALYANQSSRYYLNNFTNFDDGEHTIKAYAQDVAGNVNFTQARIVNVDTIFPTITILFPVNNSNFNNISIDFSISANENLSWCGFSLNNFANITMNLNSSLTGANYTNSSMNQGNHNFVISCNDSHGNIGTSFTYFLYVDTITPFINLTYPTPDDENITGKNWVYLNTTISDVSNTSAFFDWNASLISYLSFDSYLLNSSSGIIFDNSSHGNNGTLELVENGGAELGSLFNWNSITAVNSTDSHTGSSSFYRLGAATGTSAGLIPIDTGKIYYISGWFKSSGVIEGSRLYFGFVPYDSRRVQINNHNINPDLNTETTLFNDVSSGDKIVNITDGTNWIDTITHERMAFDVDDSGNYNDLPNFNVSNQNIVRVEDMGDHWEVEFLTTVGVNYPAGTKVREHRSGSTYMYDAASNAIVPSDWTLYTRSMQGENVYGTPTGKWWPGTKYVKMLMLFNYQQNNSYTLQFDDISLIPQDSITYAGKYGKAYSFDGFGNIVSIVDKDNSTDLTTEGTVCSWVYYNANTSGYKGIIAKGHSLKDCNYSNYALGDFNNNGNVSFCIGNGTANMASLEVTEELNTWTHLCGWFNRSSIGLYKNGVWKTPTVLNGFVPYTDNNFTTIGTWGDPNNFTRYFNGSIDEVQIYNRVLSGEEINASYNSGLYKLYHNFTELSDGNYTYRAHVIDTAGNMNFTEIRTVTVNTNLAPYNGTVLVINSSLGLNRTLEDLNVQTTLLDLNNNSMNVTVRWYNNSILHKVFEYNSSYANGTSFIATLGSGNTTKGQNWTVGLTLFDGKVSFNVNSTNLTVLNTPPNVTLIAPVNGSITFNRTSQVFTWATSDDDGDAVTQSKINITLIPASSCIDTSFDGTDIYTPIAIETFNISESTLTFNCLSDNNDYYKWSVAATDGSSYGSYTSPFNLSVQSLLSTSMNISVVEFGNLGYLKNNDTTDNSPKPLIIVNDGNTLVNVNVSATNLWNSVSNPSTNYRFKFDNVTTNGISENGSFIWSGSAITYTNVPLVTTIGVIDLNYTDARDSAEIDINVTVPSTEGPGVRTSTITFTISLGSGDTYG
ncbi:hypothetical protein J4416_01065 [Candidatus Pacearchaeota archaeon]|nr:hypothetical protein [Candidatus Pacearchaeota archaeon]HLC73148.1 LamG domain-containing protein [Candidatus Nanoarchaeia archaeon]